MCNPIFHLLSLRNLDQNGKDTFKKKWNKCRDHMTVVHGKQKCITKPACESNYIDNSKVIIVNIHDNIYIHTYTYIVMSDYNNCRQILENLPCTHNFSCDFV